MALAKAALLGLMPGDALQVSARKTGTAAFDLKGLSCGGDNAISRQFAAGVRMPLTRAMPSDIFAPWVVMPRLTVRRHPDRPN